MQRRMRIGQLAAELGLNPKTIRYYEQIGLLPDPARTEAGYRLYGADDRERLTFVLKARAIGLSLEEIGEILAVRRGGEEPCQHVLGLLERKLTEVDRQISALRLFRGELVVLRAAAAHAADADARICRIIEHYQPH